MDIEMSAWQLFALLYGWSVVSCAKYTQDRFFKAGTYKMGAPAWATDVLITGMSVFWPLVIVVDKLMGKPKSK